MYPQAKNNAVPDIFQNPPGRTSVIFAQGIISVKDRYEYGLAISPDYTELFFTAAEPGSGLMVMKKQRDGTWSVPTTANLRKNNSHEYEAFYSNDGQKLFFTSDVNDVPRLWFARRDKNEWSLPEMLDSAINSTPVFWATLTGDNTIYYTNLAAMKIYKSTFENKRYRSTEDIGLTFGWHPFVSKDENFILYNGKGDIYISYKTKDNTWSEGIKLDSTINTAEYDETCPSLSPDYNYLFFSRYDDTNKKSDIYWVKTEAITNFKKGLQ
jgi:Tol biopolymer transport system component